MSSTEAKTGVTPSETGIAVTVRERYGTAVLRVASGEAASCCGPTCCCGSAADALGLDEVNPITSNLYADDETAMLPQEAVLASLGCGNPTALATLREGRPCSISDPAADHQDKRRVLRSADGRQ
jgi:hypothetical protein